MKRALAVTGTWFALAAAGACAASDADAPNPSADAGSSGGAVIDASREEAAADAAVDSRACSPAGWCLTPLPDADLELKDVWPRGGRAFALAQSPTLGVRVLEWNGDEAGFRYIDDNTQNESGRGAHVGTIWAPDDDNVFFAVAPRTIYHGKRQSSRPDATWTWTHDELEDRGPPGAPGPGDEERGRPKAFATNLEHVALGVFGTSADDVYAWYEDTIYRRTSGDGGAAAWSVEYVADDRDLAGEHLFFLGATASGSDDVWFAGARSALPYVWFDPRACALVVRKTPAGYRRVADGVTVAGPESCAPREGTLLIGGAPGWLTDIHAIAASQVVALKGGRDVARISAAGEGSVVLSSVPSTVSRNDLISLWSAPGEPLWLGGFNLVVRGADVFDGGAYEISTIALDGAWLGLPVFQVRGSSNVDRWAVGAHHALHNTSP